MASPWTPTKGANVARLQGEHVKTIFLMTLAACVVIGMIYGTRRFNLLQGGR